jgi:hypothetical protein
VMQRRGKLKPEPCMVLDCLNRAEKHHPDYRDPLRVVWICRKHHRERFHGKP